ncbi:hypothetical protein L6452_15720 [Arctium lappa]|uniref:Uncharacterized protein n=1 Tax=Arctium lappa TaxID=4217 RepID=A0ACB9CPP7_ARCLA|nr:hypothetical protein L6452_15720 [Arctium lappa]
MRIIVNQIINDPYFKIGYKQIEFHCDHLELKDDDDIATGNNLKVMNNFDIIYFSSGYNLLGLLDDREIGEWFLSTASPEKIIEKMVEVEKGFGGIYGSNLSLSHEDEDKIVHNNSPDDEWKSMIRRIKSR